MPALLAVLLAMAPCSSARHHRLRADKPGCNIRCAQNSRQQVYQACHMRPEAWLQSMSQAEASLAQLTSVLTTKEAQLAESQRTVRDLRDSMAAEASSAAEGAAALEANLRGQVAEAQQHAEQLREKLQAKRQVRS